MKESELLYLMDSMGKSVQDRILQESSRVFSVVRLALTYSFLVVVLILLVQIFKKDNAKQVIITKKIEIKSDSILQKIRAEENIVKVSRKGRQNCVYYRKVIEDSSYFFTVCK